MSWLSTIVLDVLISVPICCPFFFVTFTFLVLIVFIQTWPGDAQGFFNVHIFRRFLANNILLTMFIVFISQLFSRFVVFINLLRLFARLLPTLLSSILLSICTINSWSSLIYGLLPQTLCPWTILFSSRLRSCMIIMLWACLLIIFHEILFFSIVAWSYSWSVLFFSFIVHQYKLLLFDSLFVTCVCFLLTDLSRFVPWCICLLWGTSVNCTLLC